MSTTRRAFTLGAATFLGALSTGKAWPGGDVASLRASVGSVQFAPPEYGATPVWFYNGKVPGPVLRIRQGERLRRLFVNSLPQPSTIHWHGVRIDNSMDGVPGLTQDLVQPDGEFLYDFEAPDAGTYWYHPHNRTWEQMARGLSGALVVGELDPPEVDRDEVLLLDDWRLTRDATLDENFRSMMDWSHAGRIGNWITVNGDGALRMTAKRNERLRLRLINAANARIFTLELRGMEGWVVAVDGQPLEQPTEAGRIVLAPAQRVDLIADVTAEPGGEAFLVSFERDGGYAIATLDVTAAARTARLSSPPALPPNPVPRIASLKDALRATLRMEGGAMGGMRGAMMGGRMMGARDLAERGGLWAFNGQADMPAAPLLEARLGQVVEIEMINDTAFPHGMHLHGHHFRRVEKSGELGPLRDTLLMARGETAKIAFVADNPGKWLLHCHMLEHAASGMMTWLKVG